MSLFPYEVMNWPGAGDVKIVTKNGVQLYETPEGDFPRVTAINKVIGTGTEGLIKWSSTTERAAVLDAVASVVSKSGPMDSASLVEAVKANLGSARAHQRVLAKAGDIGTEIHKRIQYHLQKEMGQSMGPEPKLSEPAAIAFSSWRAWWAESGRKAVRVEQPVWDPVVGYAGTVDCLTDSVHPGVLELWDWKSSTGVYDTMHIQAAAYIRAANRWGIVVPGGIVKLPKSANGSLEVEVHEIGQLYDGRKLSIDELFDCFKAARLLWGALVGPKP